MTKMRTLGEAYQEYLEDAIDIMSSFDEEWFGPLGAHIGVEVRQRFAEGAKAIATQIMGETTYYTAMKYDEGFPNPHYFMIANITHWVAVRAFVQGMQYMVDQQMLLEMVPEMKEMLDDILEAMYEANVTIAWDDDNNDTEEEE